MRTCWTWAGAVQPLKDSKHHTRFPLFHFQQRPFVYAVMLSEKRRGNSGTAGHTGVTPRFYSGGFILVNTKELARRFLLLHTRAGGGSCAGCREIRILRESCPPPSPRSAAVSENPPKCQQVWNQTVMQVQRVKHPFLQVPVPFVCFALIRNSTDPKTAQCEGIRCEMWLNSLRLTGPSGCFDNMNGGVI